MREGRINQGFLMGDSQVIGVCLGADYCAEHEWGIRGIRQMFGMSDEAFGLGNRQITKTPPQFSWLTSNAQVSGAHGRSKKIKVQGIWCPDYMWEPDDSGMRIYGPGTLWAAWCERDFGVFAYKEDEIALLEEIYKAFLAKDIAMWVGGVANPFDRGGLCIAIASRIDPKHTEAWDKWDREKEKLKADVLATGIEERLRAAGRHWFALDPRRQADGSLAFFLNPRDQKKAKSGWYKLEDLDAWIEGKGPIVAGG